MSRGFQVSVALSAALGFTLALVLGRHGESVVATQSPAAAAAAAAALLRPPLEVFDLLPIRVRNGAPVGGVQKLTVQPGAQISVGVDSDAFDHVGIEGSALRMPVAPGRETVLTFTAGPPGTYLIRLQDSKLLIGRVVVTV